MYALLGGSTICHHLQDTTHQLNKLNKADNIYSPDIISTKHIQHSNMTVQSGRQAMRLRAPLPHERVNGLHHGASLAGEVQDLQHLPSIPIRTQLRAQCRGEQGKALLSAQKSSLTCCFPSNGHLAMPF